MVAPCITATGALIRRQRARASAGVSIAWGSAFFLALFLVEIFTIPHNWPPAPSVQSDSAPREPRPTRRRYPQIVSEMKL